MIDFEGLYRAHAPSVHRFALRLSGNGALAEDIVSETFIRVWTARERVDISTVGGYLITIARHLYLDHIARNRGHDPLGHNSTGIQRDTQPGPHAIAQGRAELSAVLEDLQTLPESDRAALLMRAEEQMSYEEIGAALRISAGSARLKVHRARRKMVDLRMNRENTPV